MADDGGATSGSRSQGADRNLGWRVADIGNIDNPAVEDGDAVHVLPREEGTETGAWTVASALLSQACSRPSDRAKMRSSTISAGSSGTYRQSLGARTGKSLPRDHRARSIPQRNTAAITKAGLEGNCRIARMALELFCAMLGTIAGNAAPALAAQDRSENVSIGIVHCRFDTPVAPRIMTGCLNDSSIFSRTWASGRSRASHEAWAMPWCQPSSTMRS